MDEGKVPLRMPELKGIGNPMSLLFDKAEGLSDRIDLLTARLAVVLVPEEKDLEGTMKQECVGSPLRGDLINISNKLNVLINKLDILISRVDV